MKTFRASISVAACLFAFLATSSSQLNAQAASGEISASSAASSLLRSHTYDLDTLIRIQTSGNYSSVSANSFAITASSAIDGVYPLATAHLVTDGTNVAPLSITGTIVWNTYPLTLRISMPSNISNLFENQFFDLSAAVVDGTMLYGNYNSAVTAYKWEVSSNGSDWRTIGSTSGDSTLYTSGTENPLGISITSTLAGLRYRVTADVGPTIRNDDPVTLVSNTVTLPTVKPSYVASPAAIALDNTSNTLYVADPVTNAIWKISSGNKASILAGSATRQSGTANATGTNARFNAPAGIALHNGKLYVADTGNHAIRMIDTNGAITTFAGAPGQRGYTDGTGTNARFSYPKAISADKAGNLYVADTGNTIIRKITPAGITSHVAGTRYVSNVEFNGTGIYFTSDDVTSTGIFTFTGSVNLERTGTSLGTITLSSMYGTGAPGDLNLLDAMVFMPIDIFGNYTTTAKLLGGSTLTLTGNIFNNSDMLAPDEPGAEQTEPAPYYFNSPHGLAVSSDGNTLWVANTGNHAICKIDLATGSISEQAITLKNPWWFTVGPTPSPMTPVDDTTPINLPAGLQFASNGDLYVADMGNSRIVKFTPATGEGTLVASDVSMLLTAGLPSAHGYNNGNADQARFNFPTGLAISSAGTIYVADTDNASIRTITSGTVDTLVLEPLQTSSTTTPTGTGSTIDTGNTNTSGGGGGGGAPSAWYLLAFAALAALRLRRK